MVYSNSTCQLTCDDPIESSTCSASNFTEAQGCVCDDGFLKKGDYCVLPAECGCFMAEDNVVIPVSHYPWTF
ncbi:hypothetical protein HOLleu_23907 [Holothuria leucospilota]|uniref:TIL domain-containing protein n=1 Tax=Holothuria leucospilota TaxID=206669 RepID=A0A9Q1BVV3_HOLLE|nr:hypothetical protein HOLleu_23907 [Holothuria leucospilota]